MLTPSGWMLLVLSGVFIVLGRLFSFVELIILGATALGLVILSVAVVLFFSSKLKINRKLQYPVIVAGGTASVDLQLASLRKISLPTRGADTLLETNPGYQPVTRLVGFTFSFRNKTLSYTHQPTRRGMVSFGPVRLQTTDSFGLARRNRQITQTTELLVLPEVEAVEIPSRSTGAHWREENAHSLFGPVKGDFLGLRKYTPGDDPRDVHWKVSARTGTLHVRQNEFHKETGLSVLLDTRAEAAFREDFEKMVGAAASLLSASERQGAQAELIFPFADQQHAGQPDTSQPYTGQPTGRPAGQPVAPKRARPVRDAYRTLALLEQNPYKSSTSGVVPVLPARNLGTLVVLTGTCADAANFLEIFGALERLCQQKSSARTVFVFFGSHPLPISLKNNISETVLTPGAPVSPKTASPRQASRQTFLQVPSRSTFAEIWNQSNTAIANIPATANAPA